MSLHPLIIVGLALVAGPIGIALWIRRHDRSNRRRRILDQERWVRRLKQHHAARVAAAREDIRQRGMQVRSTNP